MSFNNGYALAVGIAQYAGKARLAPTVAKDAADLAALLKDPNTSGYPADQVDLLQDHAATKSAILSGLATLALRAGPSSTALIYFSGHGARVSTKDGPQSFLLPIDFDARDVPGTCISNAELTGAINAIKAERVVLFMDACHSGAAANPKDIEALISGKLGFDDGYYAGLAAGAGRVVMASSRPDEYSWVDARMPNSVFTHALLGALRGDAAVRGDGYVRVFDVFHHIAERVPAMEPTQHPQFKAADVESNFPLALFNGGQKGVTKAAAALPRGDEWWRTLEDVMCSLYPNGPNDNEFWSRAGGDLAQLRTSASPRGAWHAALRTLRQGGGGQGIGIVTVLATASAEFTSNTELTRLRAEGA
ncbi:MAG: caspase family protein [Hyphomonadaceae bacterium]